MMRKMLVLSAVAVAVLLAPAFGASHRAYADTNPQVDVVDQAVLVGPEPESVLVTLQYKCYGGGNPAVNQYLEVDVSQNNADAADGVGGSGSIVFSGTANPLNCNGEWNSISVTVSPKNGA